MHENEMAVASEPPTEGAVQCKYGWTPMPVNSHLIYSNRHAFSVQRQSMTDLRVAEEEIRRRRFVFTITLGFDMSK